MQSQHMYRSDRYRSNHFHLWYR